MSANIARQRLAAAIEHQRHMPLDRAHASLPTLTTRPDMIEPEDIKRVKAAADEIAERVEARMRPAFDDVQRRVNAEVQRLDARATKETARWSGWQWAGFITAIVCLLALAFGAGRATADEHVGCPNGWLIDATGEWFDLDAHLATEPRPAVTLRCSETAQDGADMSSDVQ